MDSQIRSITTENSAETVQNPDTQLKPVNKNIISFECLKDYSDIQPIGHGAQATVFKAKDKSGQFAAIKCFDKQGFQSWKDEELLRREVDTIRELHISGVPEYIDFVEDKRYAFLVESYIDAPSLAQRIEQGFRPTTDEVVKLLKNVARILLELESLINPVIHRDIKPANILVDDEMNAFIVDFGVVAAIRQHTVGMTFAGTAGYLAPEQLYNKVTPAADIFGLGMSIIHLITGMAPCDMDMDGLKPKIDKYIPLSAPDALVVLLHDMIEPDPSHRIADAKELIQRLDNLDFRPLKLQKKSKQFNALTEEQKIAIRERVRKKRENMMRKIALRVAGPNAIQTNPEKYIKIENKHKPVSRQLDIYQVALRVGGIRFIFIVLFVLMAAGIDGLLYYSIPSWESIFFNHILAFTTIASIISCLYLSIYHHCHDRGFVKLSDKSYYLKSVQNKNRILNDTYRYALIDENTIFIDECYPQRLSELYWDMMSDKDSHSDETTSESNVQKPSESKPAESESNEQKTAEPDNSEELLSNIEIQDMEDTVFEDISNLQNENISKYLTANEEQKEGYESLEQECLPRRYLMTNAFCIAYPPQKLSKLKLAKSAVYLVMILIFIYAIPISLHTEAVSALDIIIYYLVNSVFIGLPVYMMWRYIQKDSICSKLYHERFQQFSDEFIRECRGCKTQAQVSKGSLSESQNQALENAAISLESNEPNDENH